MNNLLPFPKRELLSSTSFGFPMSVTSSILSDYKACPHLFAEKYIRHVYPENESIHLVAGAAFAAGLQAAREAFYIRGADEDDARLVGFRALLENWREPTGGLRTKKPIDRIADALQAYIDEYPFIVDRIQPAMIEERHGIEFSFALPLPLNHPVTGDPLLYEGRCDMIGDYEGTLVVTDEKTTGQLGQSWSSNFRLRGQFIGYTWAARASGIPVLGVLVRGIAIRSSGFDFAQSVHLYPDHLIDEWYNDMLYTVEQMIVDYKNDRFPKDYGQSCTSYGGCAFVDRCASRFPDELPGYVVKDKLYFERT